MKDQRLLTIVSTIRNRRVQLNYSQEYIAAKMNIGQNCYSKIELGYNKLTVERLFKMCEILEMDVFDLLIAC